MPKGDQIPRSVLKTLIKDALSDPQLPRPGPTEAFWQIPSAEISRIQSPNLPKDVTTYAIVGSGITACSVAKNLLELADPKSTVIILEARDLCSGATGRNGGHLLSPIPEEFGLFEKALGREEAIKIARFANRTLETMYRLAEETDPELAEVAEARRVKSVVAYYDEGVFEEAKRSHRRYEECVSEARGDHQVFGKDEAVEQFNMKNAVGVITNSAGAFWPYRLVTGLYSRLLKQYPDRFSIETNTPITKVSKGNNENDSNYTLHTPRGTLQAQNVIYCTNGWTSHLLPHLRGKIFPLRGTMSVQTPGPDFPNEGAQKSWSTLEPPRFNAADGTISFGLYYITQNAKTGDLFIGGEKQKATEILSSDDTRISEVSRENLEEVLGTIYDKGCEQTNTRSIWSGVMGFTPDHMPWVGRLPDKGAGNEFVAAGFNGYGMPLCWGAGEAVAKMCLGREEEVREWFPEAFRVTEKRLGSPYSSIEFGVGMLLEGSLGLWTKGWLVWRYFVRRMFG